MRSSTNILPSSRNGAACRTKLRGSVAYLRRAGEINMKSTCIAAAVIVLFAVGGTALAEMPKSIGEGEGEVDIVAWTGYIERGETDKNYDWVTAFEKETGCKVNAKTAATSDEMVTLMNQGGFRSGE